jgi:anti-sigma regulatory factor (Ser/Thr protein kinase)
MSDPFAGPARFSFTSNNPAADKSHFFDQLRAFSANSGWPAPIANEVELILEEWWTNLVTYALTGRSNPFVSVSIQASRTQTAIEVRDNGDPFDPTARPDPDLTLPIEERPIGGLGIYMMKKLSRRLVHERKADYNILRIEKDLTQPVLGRPKT